ncbi:MAG: hypothetical protein ACI4P4_07480, partial [Faecousia sp.]
EKSCEFAGSFRKTQRFSAHLISLASLDSFPSRGSLGALQTSTFSRNNIVGAALAAARRLYSDDTKRSFVYAISR